MLNEGDKLLVSHRRLFAHDEVRYFVGTVASYEAGIVKLVGRTYLKDFGTGAMVSKSDVRTKVYSLASGTILVYQLAATTNMDALEFVGGEGVARPTDE